MFKQVICTKGAAVFNIRVPFIDEKIFQSLFNMFYEPEWIFNYLRSPKTATAAFIQNVLIDKNHLDVCIISELYAK